MESNALNLRKRQEHTRSRTGCLTCRKRHVRCDEHQPSCNNCTNRGLACEYSRKHIQLQERRRSMQFLPGVQKPWKLGTPNRRSSTLSDPLPNHTVKFRSKTQTDTCLSTVPSLTGLTAEHQFLFYKVLSHFVSGPLYPLDLRNAINDDSNCSKCIRLLVTDEAYLRCMVAISVTALDVLIEGQADGGEVALNLSHTFRLLNQKLSGDEALSDETLVIVTSMTQYDRLRSQYHQGMVHFEGLRRIIELRGGISKLIRYRPLLAEKVLRADLEFALHLGSATYFNVGSVHATLTRLRTKFVQDQKPRSYSLQNSQSISAELQDIWLDVLSFAWFLNYCSDHDIKFSVYTFNDAVTYLGHRLLYINPLQGRRSANCLENLLQLGLLCFISNFLLGLDRKIPAFNLLSKQTRVAIQNHTDKDKADLELILWVLFIGQASTFTQIDERWLPSKVADVAQILDLHSWKDVQQTLQTFPWVDTLHDKPSKAFWMSLVL